MGKERRENWFDNVVGNVGCEQNYCAVGDNYTVRVVFKEKKKFKRNFIWRAVAAEREKRA